MALVAPLWPCQMSSLDCTAKKGGQVGLTEEKLRRLSCFDNGCRVGDRHLRNCGQDEDTLINRLLVHMCKLFAHNGCSLNCTTASHTLHLMCFLLPFTKQLSNMKIKLRIKSTLKGGYARCFLVRKDKSLWLFSLF